MGKGRAGNNISEDKGFARVGNDMQKSAAFQALSASAIRVLLWSIYRNFNRATNRFKGDQGKPTFKLTYAEAMDKLGMTAPTFTRAKDELADKGFLEWRKRGGLKGANGVASEYQLSSAWKDWKPPKKQRSDMGHARKAKQRST